jgi:hypothetical protein
MQQTLADDFEVQDRGGGLWRLTNHRAPATTIFLQGVDATTAAPVQCSSVTLEWQAAGAVFVAMDGATRVTVRARAAFLHEPQQSLYAALPLATFTNAARRFWRRVFLIVRLPGGRLLVGLLARRARSAG